MATDAINYGTNDSSITYNSLIEFPSEKDPSCFQKFLHSKSFKYIKRILLIIFILNLLGWGNLLLFIAIGAANKIMPDEHTRKVWTEISLQVINGLIFVMIIIVTPWRIRDLYHLHNKKHRPILLQRHTYTTNLIWLHFILWSLIINSVVQVAVVICLWSMNMYKRPAWLVNVFGGLGLITGVFAGLAQFILGRITKKKAKMEQQSTSIV